MNTVDLGELTLAGGGHLLVRRAVRALGTGEELEVIGSDPALGIDLTAWARGAGIPIRGRVLTRTPAAEGRWVGAERAGAVAGVVEAPPARWGLAARGAAVEPWTGLEFPISERKEVWTDEAGRMYARAAAAQWDPASLPWGTVMTHPREVEDAVVQVMTYLIENEVAALLVPARFLSQIHPHFREVLQVLAVQAADEARHIEVFTRRAVMGGGPGLSTAGGQASLATLVVEPDFAVAGFLLSVLGEGTFLTLLWFLAEHAPDDLTREIARRAAQDEARHVAFGMAHLNTHLEAEPELRVRLANAVERRHNALAQTAGLNEEVYDALMLLAAGGWSHTEIARGAEAVQEMVREMDEQRRGRLRMLGFSEEEAGRLSGWHTRNFM